jgi:Ca2+-binding EF-hand superfamily protein
MPASLPSLKRKANAFYSRITGEQSFHFDNVLRCFHIYDWTDPPCGFVDAPEFKRAIANIGFLFSESEVDFIVKHFKANAGSGADADADGAVEYNEFVSWACPMHSSKAGSHGLGVVSATVLKVHLQNALRAGNDLLGLFRARDAQGSGILSSEEFCRALQGGTNLPSLSPDEAYSVASLVSSSTDGSLILYRKFVTALLSEGGGGVASVDPVQALDVGLGKAGATIRRLRDVFEYYDRKHNGRVRQEDLEVVLEEIGVQLRSREVDAIKNQYNVDGSGWILYSGLVSALDIRRASKGAADRETLATTAVISKDISQKLVATFNSFVERGIDFRSEFDRLDKDTTGSILVSDFEHVLLKVLGSDLDDAVIDIIKQYYTLAGPVSTTKDNDRGRDESLARFDHMRLMRDYHPPPRPLESPENEHVSAILLADELRLKVRRRYGRRELSKPFRHFARKRGESGFATDDLEVRCSV